RYVGDHTDAYGLIELLADAGDRVGAGESSGRFGNGCGRGPVAALPDFAALGRHPASSGQAANRTIRGRRVGDVVERQVEAQRIAIGLERHAGGAQARNLAREVDALRQDRVVERLLAESIAREKEALAPRVPDRVGVHAAQPLQAFGTFLFVEVNQRLRVGRGVELVAARDQIGAQFLVLVDLAVEDDPDAAIFIGDGLVAGIEVDDGEAAHTDGAAAIDIDAFLIGAAVANLAAHRANRRLFRFLMEQDK